MTYTVDGEAGLVEDTGVLGLVPHEVGLAVRAGVEEGGHEVEAGPGEARHQAPPYARKHWGRGLEVLYCTSPTQYSDPAEERSVPESPRQLHREGALSLELTELGSLPSLLLIIRKILPIFFMCLLVSHQLLEAVVFLLRHPAVVNLVESCNFLRPGHLDTLATPGFLVADNAGT